MDVLKGKWLFVVLAVLALLTIFSATYERFWATVSVFVLCLIVFHLILFRFSKHENVWKATDYLFEVAAILSLIAAVASLSQASKYETLQKEFADRKLAQVMLLYAVETVVTNDCDPLQSRKDVWEVSPEPVKGECDRLKHFLPQMRHDFDRETGPENMTSETDRAYNLLYPDKDLSGTWSMIETMAERFMEVSESNRVAIKQWKESKSTEFDIAKIDRIFYWYHLLAALLALKIARISMEIFKK